MAITLSIANQKGGVGKTTTAYNLGWALAEKNMRVLLIDNDPQGNLTSYGMEKSEKSFMTIDEIYVSKRPVCISKSQLVMLGDRVHLLPADPMLAGAEYYLMARPDKESVLRNALKDIQHLFDYIIIDNPPALNLLTVNGLMASNRVLIPVQLEFFSLEGVVLLEKTMNALREKNPELKLLGIIPNMFDDRRKLNWEVLEALKKEFGDKVLQSRIHDSVKIAESSGHGQHLIAYAPGSRAAAEYSGLAKEVIENVQEQ